MKNKKRLPTWAFILTSYLGIFLAISFIVTACVMIFLSNSNVEEEMIRQRAPRAFANIFVLTGIFTLFSVVLKYFWIDLPVRKIAEATQKIAAGDFSVRLYKENMMLLVDYKMIYENFNKMAEALGQTESLQSDFISNVSHEMKTPLAVIQNYSTLLQNPAISQEERKDYTQTIFENTQKMTDLVTNILKLNKLENQKISLEKKSFNLGENLSSCLLNFEQIWENKNINIQTQIDDEIFIESDENLLSLVWNNLISNALKFTQSGGSVTVKCFNDGDISCVQVSDTGCGISARDGRRIFDKFYQCDTSHKTQGNGLGLALVKKVVDLMGAEIAVQSEAGKGSTFEIRIKNTPKNGGQQNE